MAAKKKKVVNGPDLGALQSQLEEAKQIQEEKELALIDRRVILDEAKDGLTEASIELTEAKRYTDQCYEALEVAAEEVLGLKCS